MAHQTGSRLENQISRIGQPRTLGPGETEPHARRVRPRVHDHIVFQPSGDATKVDIHPRKDVAIANSGIALDIANPGSRVASGNVVGLSGKGVETFDDRRTIRAPKGHAQTFMRVGELPAHFVGFENPHRPGVPGQVADRGAKLAKVLFEVERNGNMLRSDIVSCHEQKEENAGRPVEHAFIIGARRGAGHRPAHLRISLRWRCDRRRTDENQAHREIRRCHRTPTALQAHISLCPLGALGSWLWSLLPRRLCVSAVKCLSV